MSDATDRTLQPYRAPVARDSVHVDDDVLRRHAAGVLAEDAALAVTRHLLACDGDCVVRLRRHAVAADREQRAMGTAFARPSDDLPVMPEPTGGAMPLPPHAPPTFAPMGPAPPRPSFALPQYLAAAARPRLPGGAAPSDDDADLD